MGAQATPPRRTRPVLTALALAAQAVVAFVTLVTGIWLVGVFWVVALTQAVVGVGVVAWWAPRKHGAMVLVVPAISFGFTVGLIELSNTVAVACSDRVVAAFEQLPPPKGASFEMFVGGEMQDCMAEMRGQVKWQDAAAHYRNEFSDQGWRIAHDDGELRAEKDGMYISLDPAEGTVYFILGEL